MRQAERRQMKVAIVIPARYGSSRFPGKPLVKIAGQELIVRVAKRCEQAIDPRYIYVATDDERIESVVKKNGFNVVLTSPDALTGTDRVAEAASQIDAEVIINVQGDEPLVNPADIKQAILAKQQFPDSVVNFYCDVGDDEDPDNVNLPKVVVNENEYLLYMSRAAVPSAKESSRKLRARKQVCIYAFNQSELRAFRDFGRKSVLESSEDIEILRFFELGIAIKMMRAQGMTIAVDVPDDVRKVERALTSMR